MNCWRSSISKFSYTLCGIITALVLSFTFAHAKEHVAPENQTLLVKEDCRAAIALAARKKGVP